MGVGSVVGGWWLVGGGGGVCWYGVVMCKGCDCSGVVPLVVCSTKCM